MGNPHQLYPVSQNQRLPSMTAQKLFSASRNLNIFLQSPMMASNLRKVNLGLAPIEIVRSVDQTLSELPKLEEVVYPMSGWGSTHELTQFEKRLRFRRPDIRLLRLELNTM